MDGTGKSLGRFRGAVASGAETQVVTYPVDRVMGYAELETLVRGALPKDREFVILGESFSGPIAVRLAADAPPGLSGVILCTTFVKNPYRLLGWAGPFAGLLPFKSLPRWVRAPLMWGSAAASAAPPKRARATAGVDSAVLRHRIAALLSVDETASLSKIRIPALIISGLNDRVIPKSATAHMARCLPRAEHVQLDGPHLLLQTAPEVCAALVQRFMTSCRRHR
jgi:pimeloyl-ACP methyl ester carboxylesterase